MRGYAETEVFDPAEIRLFRTAQQAVDCLPDMPNLRCHEVARAVSRVLKLKVVDGWYGAVDHSWLEVPRSKGFPLILDLYAVGRVPMVQLLDVGWLHPDYDQYYVRTTHGWSMKRERYRNAHRLHPRGEWILWERNDIQNNVVDLLFNILVEAGFVEEAT